MSSDLWQALLPYQSGDLVRRLYQQRNQRPPSDDVVSEIRAHFIQGASYFQAARDAADVVKPLILYYGCLALSRGTIWFLSEDGGGAGSQDGKETTPKRLKNRTHGLTAKDWGSVLSAEENCAVLDLNLEFMRAGTFHELFQATGNKNYLENNPVFWQSYHANQAAGRKIVFRDILSRIPRLTSVYEQTLCQPSHCLVAIYRLPCSAPEEVTFAIGRSGLARRLAPDQTLKRLLSLAGVSVIRDDEKAVQFRSSAHGEHSPVPIATWPRGPGWGESGLVVLPFDDGSFFSELLMCFFVAFFLGTLARYHPSTWMGLLYGGVNDEALPLLRAAVEHVENDFPTFILSSLTERRYF